MWLVAQIESVVRGVLGHQVVREVVAEIGKWRGQGSRGRWVRGEVRQWGLKSWRRRGGGCDGGSEA